eukprot:SAG31_NODE_206_length_20335_cov_17.910160_3_plen_122_part_00
MQQLLRFSDELRKQVLEQEGESLERGGEDLGLVLRRASLHATTFERGGDSLNCRRKEFPELLAQIPREVRKEVEQRNHGARVRRSEMVQQPANMIKDSIRLDLTTCLTIIRWAILKWKRSR